MSRTNAVGRAWGRDVAARVLWIGSVVLAMTPMQATRVVAEARFDHAVELSRIFEWFAEGFTAAGKTLADRLSPYLSEEQRRLMATLPVRFLEYDWTMNTQAGQRP